VIRLILHSGETLEANDDVFDLTPLGVRRDEVVEGVKTGDWTLIPWVNIVEVQRVRGTA
jgi:hypothetical protein